MSANSNRKRIGVVFALALVPCWAQKQELCNLAGTVDNSATNAGIPHAMVIVYGAANGYRFTDSAGNFQFSSVPCESYSLQVSKPGFVSGQEQPPQVGNPFAEMLNNSDPQGQAQRAPEPVTQFVKLMPDSPRARIALIPVASVMGTVLDENSEPVAGVSVQAIAVKASLSGVDYVAAKTAQTDDRGHYALLTLTPGDYLVRLAGEASATSYFQGAVINVLNDHRGMTPLYYPNATSASEATVLTLAPAAKSTVDFQHPTEPAVDVNGHVSGLTPEGFTQIKLYRDGDRLPVGRAFVNLTTGQFRLTDVPRGSYTLRVAEFLTTPSRWLAVEEQLNVASELVRDFNVQLAPGADIPISVSYEAGAQEGASIQLWLQPQHAPENLRLAVPGIRPAGRAVFNSNPQPRQPPESPEPSAPLSPVFTDVIPDRYKLTVQAIGGNEYVASARLGDLDVLHGEFSIGTSAPGELRLTIRGDSAALEGQVSVQGEPALGARIYLIPASGDATGVKAGVGGEKGHFEIHGVPPGDYRIRAWTGQPTAKELLSGGGETTTLQPNEKQTVTIEAVPSENKGGLVQ